MLTHRVYGCCSAQFVWAVVVDSLYMGCCSAQFVLAVVVYKLYVRCSSTQFEYGFCGAQFVYGSL